MDLISCLCLTITSRQEYLKRAKDCFERQTYPNRELIVVADEHLTVGKKRNMGCQLAKGKYIAVWDDDDYSAPRRLEVQEAALRTSGKAVTAFRQIPFVENGTNWYMHPGTDKEGLDTSLFFRRDFWESHPFESLMVGQDAKFSRQAIAEKSFLLMEDQGLMFAENHPANTCERVLSHWAKLEGYRWRD